MVGGAHTQHRAIQSEQLLPKGAYEDWVSIGNNTVREPVELTHYINEQSGHLECHELSGQGSEVDSFGKPVNHHKDHRETMRTLKVRNEIHGKVFPHAIRYWNWL